MYIPVRSIKNLIGDTRLRKQIRQSKEHPNRLGNIAGLIQHLIFIKTTYFSSEFIAILDLPMQLKDHTFQMK